MSGNTSAKKALIKRYGPKCFIESLKLRDTSHITYKGKAQRARMKALTYHHIRERVFGGRATVENGALLSAENHAWFNRQPKEAQRVFGICLCDNYLLYFILFVLEEYQGQGYATEAVGAAVTWALQQPFVTCVETETAPDNRASQRVLEKCGFLPSGTIGEEGPRFFKVMK